MRDNDAPSTTIPAMLPITGDTLGAAIITDLYSDICRPTSARSFLSMLNYFGCDRAADIALDDFRDCDLRLLLFSNDDIPLKADAQAWDRVVNALPTLAREATARAHDIVNLTKEN